MSLNEELINDYAVLTRTNLCTVHSDLASCYDRIILPVSSLIARSYGIHRNAVYIQSTNIQNSTYRLKLGYDITDSFYKHQEDWGIYGSGQGSASSPAVWAFISSKLFQSHDQKAHGMNLVLSSGEVIGNVAITGFVDDTVTYTSGETPESMLAKATEDVQLWNNLLFASGGRLELKKTCCHITRFQFHPDGTPYHHHEKHQPMQIQDHHGNYVAITENSIYQPTKSLGHWKAPAGKRTVQYEEILNKAIKIASNIGRCPVSRESARALYETVFRPSIEYTIPQTFLTPTQMQTIQSKAYPQIFAKCGYNRNTHRSILFGPKDLGGGGFTPLIVKQGTEMVKHFIKHWRSPHTTTGKLLRAVLNWTQHQAGVSYSLLTRTDTKIDYIQSEFILTVQNYLNSIEATIQLDQTFVCKPL